MDVNIEVSNRFASFLTDWDYEQYLLLGGYGSGKSYHVALKIILKLQRIIVVQDCLVPMYIAVPTKYLVLALTTDSK